MAGRRSRAKSAKLAVTAEALMGRATPRPGNRDARLEALAERCCPRQTSGDVRSELVQPSRNRRLSADQVRALVRDRVAAVVARTCEWGQMGRDWEVGDHRCLILSYSVKGDAGFYVQLWAEPEEPVIVEACSGAWNPAVRLYIGPPQRAALRRLGYRVGGRARNYGKTWTVSSAADAAALAEEFVGILVDVFGYRAGRPLELTYFAGRRTSSAPVFPALARDDVERMLRMGGFGLTDARPAGRVAPGVKKRLIHATEPFPLAVELKGEVPEEPHGYEAMRLITPIPGGQGVSDAQLAAIARACPFLRVFRDDEGDVLAIYDVPVAGTTVRWFLLMLQIVGVMRARVVSMVQEALAARHGLARGGRGRGGSSGDGGEDSAESEADADEDDPADEEDASGSAGPGRSSRIVVH